MDIRRLWGSVLDIHFTDNACYVMNSSLFILRSVHLCGSLLKHLGHNKRDEIL